MMYEFFYNCHKDSCIDIPMSEYSNVKNSQNTANCVVIEWNSTVEGSGEG